MNMVPTNQRPGAQGSEAQSKPPAGDTQNASTSAEQRQPDRIKDVGDGPKIQENGSYAPARYKTMPRRREVSPGVFVELGTNIREDR